MTQQEPRQRATAQQTVTQVERYTTEALLLPDAPARVMRPVLRHVDVHWHDFFELCLIDSGTAVHVVNGVERTVGPGSAFLLSPADFHELHSLGSEPLTCYNTVIDAQVMEQQLDVLGPLGAQDFPWVVDDFADSVADFRRLQGEFELPAAGSSAVANALVTCLLVELARRCEPASASADASAGADEDVQRAVRFIDRQFREPLTLADAARQAHLSANYFSERFRDYTGTSFQTYLQERRLRFARSLLASTTLGVTQVCHAAGFNSLSHFGRAYRRRYGAAPSARRDDLRSAAAAHLP